MRREPGGGALHTGGDEIAANSPDIIAPTEMLQTRKSAISETPTPNTPAVPPLQSMAHHGSHPKEGLVLVFRCGKGIIQILLQMGLGGAKRNCKKNPPINITIKRKLAMLRDKHTKFSEKI